MLKIDAEPQGQLLIGLLGCGRLARQLADLVDRDREQRFRIVSVLARRSSPALHDTAQRLNARACTKLGEALEARPDVIVEVASADALAKLGPKILAAGVDVVALSPSCFTDPNVEGKFRRAVAYGNRTLYIPSASAVGVEFLSALHEDTVSRVHVTITWKPPADALPTVVGNGSHEIFSGSAREAGRRYPAQLNFVVTLGLAGIGLDKTTVRVLLDPAATCTSYVLEAEGGAGELVGAVTLRRPNDEPGRLAVLAALDTLRQLRGLMQRSAYAGVETVPAKTSPT